jgi:hypothetical protein
LPELLVSLSPAVLFDELLHAANNSAKNKIVLVIRFD